MTSKANIKKVLIICVVLSLVIMVIGVFLTTIASETFYKPNGNVGDNVTIDIGSDGYLIAFFNNTTKISEKNISDGVVNTSNGKIQWHNAKNTTIVDLNGTKGSIITWSEKFENASGDYDYGYCNGELINGSYFINSHSNTLYGMIIDKSLGYTFTDILYVILGFVSNDVPIDNDYNTVITSESLINTDPDWYYDHYEYGDNYEYDDYLESEGYD